MKIDLTSKDIKLKILSIIIAIIIWLYIMGDLGYSLLFFNMGKNNKEVVVKNVPVSILQKSNGFRGNINIDPKFVDVTILGNRKKVMSISKERIVAYVDVSGFGKGKYSSIIKILVPEDVITKSNINKVNVEIGVDWDKENQQAFNTFIVNKDKK